jgi:hypothetical protein
VKDTTKIIHANSWEEFKRLMKALHPEFIAYAAQNAPLSRPPIGLRLMFTTENKQYVFLDFAHGHVFERSKLPVYLGEDGDAHFKEDLSDLLRSELNRKDINIISFEVLGY